MAIQVKAMIILDVIQIMKVLSLNQKVSNLHKRLLSESNAHMKHNKSSMNFEPKVVNGISLFPK